MLTLAGIHTKGNTTEMAKRNSVMKHQFSQVPKAQIPRSSFDRTHGLKTAFDAGLLIPIFVDEALPGDTFNVNMTGFARLATPIKPLFDNMFMETFFFAVPKRLLWDNWQKFNGEQDNPDDSTDFLIPTLTSPAGGYLEETLEDYLGLPTKIAGVEHSSLWHRAYNLIWNEWFRDQNLQDSVNVPKGDGPDTGGDFTLLRRGKRHDYFTSCLPWPQKGDPVSIPIAGAKVVPDPDAGSQAYVLLNANGQDVSLRHETGNTDVQWNTSPTGTGLVTWGDQNGVTNLAVADEAGAATINSLRQAFQIQKLLERDARGGTRYTEIVRAHFGVVSPDARLQRPEYLGGGRSYVNINPVAQTTQDIDGAGANTPQGNLAAYGTSSLTGHGFTKSFTEHCVLIGLVNVRADLTYQDGLDRMFSRSGRYDFYWPALSHIGEQAVLNKEIYAQGNANDDMVFGYQERYAEYRYKPSKITGKMRSNAADSLDIWHLSQDFPVQPALDGDFIQDNPPIDRIIAVPDEPHFLFDAHFSMRCARPMPLYGVPGLIDHF